MKVKIPITDPVLDSDTYELIVTIGKLGDCLWNIDMNTAPQNNDKLLHVYQDFACLVKYSVELIKLQIKEDIQYRIEREKEDNEKQKGE